jgi:DNA-binding GntR family transcriptional regulator
VREALSHPASEGFVVSEPQRGFRVAPLSVDTLRDLTDVRCSIEALCLRGAIEKGGTPCRTRPYGPIRPRGATATNMRRLTRFFMKSSRRDAAALASSFAKVDRDLDREHREIAEAALSRDRSPRSGAHAS